MNSETKSRPVINNKQRTNIDFVMTMNSYLNLDSEHFTDIRQELELVSSKLRGMNQENISILINMFGSKFTEYYLEKQRLLGNKFEYETIEPFIDYLDSYLIEYSGGNTRELNKLGKELIGEDLKLPTQRLMRLSILDKYFHPYIVG